MDAKKCDRCGKYYNENKKYKEKCRIGRVVFEEYIDGVKFSVKDHTGKRIDLCDDCITELRKFLNMEE